MWEKEIIDRVKSSVLNDPEIRAAVDSYSRAVDEYQEQCRDIRRRLDEAFSNNPFNNKEYE